MMLPQIIELSSRTDNIKYLRLFFTSKTLYTCLIKALYQRNSAIKLVIPQSTFICITQCMFCGIRKSENDLIHYQTSLNLRMALPVAPAEIKRVF